MSVVTTRERKRTSPVALAVMHTALRQDPHSLDSLVVLTGLEKPVIARQIKALGEAGMIHVGGWARDGRGYPTIRRFSWGNCADVACPKSTGTSASRMAVLRASDPQKSRAKSSAYYAANREKLLTAASSRRAAVRDAQQASEVRA